MPEVHLLDRLMQVTDLFQRDMARAFAGTDLTMSRMGVLWVVHHSGPLAQNAIAGALDVTPKHVSGLVDALESARLVVRLPSPGDRRAHLIELTPDGAALMARTAREHAELSATLLEAVDPADRAAFERGLDAVIERIGRLMAAEGS